MSSKLTSFDFLVALRGLREKMLEHKSRCLDECRELAMNQAVCNHFKAMEVAYGHCARLLEKRMEELFPEEKA
jgi:hypothetical protein